MCVCGLYLVSHLKKSIFSLRFHYFLFRRVSFFLTICQICFWLKSSLTVHIRLFFLIDFMNQFGLKICCCVSAGVHFNFMLCQAAFVLEISFLWTDFSYFFSAISQLSSSCEMNCVIFLFELESNLIRSIYYVDDWEICGCLVIIGFVDEMNGYYGLIVVFSMEFQRGLMC